MNCRPVVIAAFLVVLTGCDLRDMQAGKTRVVATRQRVHALALDLEDAQSVWGPHFGTNTVDTNCNLDQYCALFPTNCWSAPDPWSNQYRIVLDTDGDGHVNIGSVRVKAIAAAWSCGPNGIDEKGAGDDIVSWR